jgi:sulfur carrier protein
MITVNGNEYPWHEGMTVTELLELLDDDYDYPAVKHSHKIISKPHFETTTLPDGVEVYLIPLIAGG